MLDERRKLRKERLDEGYNVLVGKMHHCILLPRHIDLVLFTEVPFIIPDATVQESVLPNEEFQHRNDILLVLLTLFAAGKLQAIQP